MTILDDLADPDMFGPLFPRHTVVRDGRGNVTFEGDSFAAWRAFHAARAGLPMTDEEAAIYHECTGRSDLPTEPFQETVVICGRRGGKSRNIATLAAHLAVARDYSGHLAPGEVVRIPVVASDRKQARSIFGYAAGLFAGVPALKPWVLDMTAEAINLVDPDNPRGLVSIEITTASMRATRGATYGAFIGDEVAFWRDETGANPDTEILAAAEPGLLTIPGAPTLLCSSPYRRAGLLWKKFEAHYGKDGSPVLVWKAPSRRMNPTLSEAFIARKYAEDPERASAEYGAEFRSDIGSFVEREVVKGCTVPGRYELPYVSGQRYAAFVDPSGGSSDAMTLAIAHADPQDRRRGVLDAVRVVKPPFSPEAVVAEFAGVLKSYRITKVKGDRYGGEWCREPFRKAGIAYEISEKPKGEIYLNGLPLLNAGRVELLDVPLLANQLCRLERRTARGGRDSIDHPPGEHDDLANAAMGALLDAVATRPALVISDEALAASARPDLARMRSLAMAGIGR